MDLRQLKTFRMVAATLSITQTAAALDYAQSSVTAQIQGLESDLGVPLFDRLGKRLVLTEAGEKLLPYADRLLAMADEARSAVVGDHEPAGTLAISAPETLCTYRLPLVLGRMRELHPGVRVLFRPTHVADLRRKVTEGTLDLAFVLEDPIQTTELAVEPLIREPVCVIAPPGHPLTGRDAVYARDLAGEPALLTDLGCSYRNQFERALIAAGAYPSTVLEFSSIESIKQCVMAGMGIAVLPEVAIRAEIGAGHLAALPWAERPFEVVTQMIWHSSKWVSPAMQAFIDVTRQVLCASQHQTKDD